MAKRPPFKDVSTKQVEDTAYTCPHCGVLQVTQALLVFVGPITYVHRQCRHCRDVDIRYSLFTMDGFGQVTHQGEKRLHPQGNARPPKTFAAAPGEVETAYNEACLLTGVHTGAAGAYARRALELLLDHAGYATKVLAESIKLVGKEVDPDRRLPKRLILKLDYIREIGNFAVHIRRDQELVIVEISDEEVEACLETIEDLVAFIYDEPAAEYLRVVNLNEKLSAAGKKAIELPPLPPGLDAHRLLGHAPEKPSAKEAEAAKPSVAEGA